MKVVAVITATADRRLHRSLLPRQSRGGRRRGVIDRIRRHLEKTGREDPSEAGHLRHLPLPEVIRRFSP